MLKQKIVYGNKKAIEIVSSGLYLRNCFWKWMSFFYAPVTIHERVCGHSFKMQIGGLEINVNSATTFYQENMFL